LHDLPTAEGEELVREVRGASTGSGDLLEVVEDGLKREKKK